MIFESSIINRRQRGICYRIVFISLTVLFSSMFVLCKKKEEKFDTMFAQFACRHILIVRLYQTCLKSLLLVNNAWLVRIIYIIKINQIPRLIVRRSHILLSQFLFLTNWPSSIRVVVLYDTIYHPPSRSNYLKAWSTMVRRKEYRNAMHMNNKDSHQ